MKWTSRKKLKAEITELKKCNNALLIERYELCEDYDSKESLRIRTGHSIEKQMAREVFRGNIEKDPVLRGIFKQAEELTTDSE